MWLIRCCIATNTKQIEQAGLYFTNHIFPLCLSQFDQKPLTFHKLPEGAYKQCVLMTMQISGSRIWSNYAFRLGMIFNITKQCYLLAGVNEIYMFLS